MGAFIYESYIERDFTYRNGAEYAYIEVLIHCLVGEEFGGGTRGVSCDERGRTRCIQCHTQPLEKNKGKFILPRYRRQWQFSILVERSWRDRSCSTQLNVYYKGSEVKIFQKRSDRPSSSITINFAYIFVYTFTVCTVQVHIFASRSSEAGKRRSSASNLVSARSTKLKPGSIGGQPRPEPCPRFVSFPPTPFQGIVRGKL